MPHGCCRCHDTRRVNRGDGVTEICRCAPDAQPPAEVQLRLDGVPAQHINARLDMLDDPMRTTLGLWCSVWPRPDKHMLLFGGEVGSGKTLAACACGRAVYERHGQRCVFHAVPDLIARLRATQSDERTESEGAVIAAVHAAPLLILDDLGKERGTGFAQEMLFGVIDYRWREGKATITTGNVGDLATLPEALRSRIGSGIRIEFTGRDRRAEGRKR